MDQISKYYWLPWELLVLSDRAEITFDILQRVAKYQNKDLSSMELINISKYVDINSFRNNQHIKWDHLGLSMNKNITVKDIDTYKGNWDWYSISKRIPIQDVINNPDKPWNVQGLYENPDITKEVLLMFCSEGYYDEYFNPRGNLYNYYKNGKRSSSLFSNKYITIPDVFSILGLSIPFPPQSIARINSYADVDICY